MELLGIKQVIDIYNHKDDFITVFMHDRNQPIVSFKLTTMDDELIYESPFVYENEEKAAEVIRTIVKLSTDKVKVMCN